MSEGKPASENEPDKDDFKPILSQDEFNQRLAERVQRERAKFADYAQLQAKAAELDSIKEANKSDAEKAEARVRAETDRADAAERGLLRMSVAAKFGITDSDDVDLFLTGSDEETLTKQAERLAARGGDSGGVHAPREGKPISKPAPDERRAFADFLTGNS